MHAWIAWVAAAAVLGVVEMVTLAFVTFYVVKRRTKSRSARAVYR